MQNIDDIYKTYGKIVYKYIFCLCNDKCLAEDIVQETFLVAVENIDKFKGESKLSSWLCSIAKYIWYRNLRENKKANKLSLEELENTLIFDSQIEENILQKEEKIELYKKIQLLDEETKNIMYLRLLGNLSYEEIADILGKTQNSVRVKFFRGKEKIIKENKKYE